MHAHKTSLAVSFDFYVAFNHVNITNVAFDHQITIINAENAFFLEPIDQPNEFILIDLECQNGLDILFNDDRKLENNFWILLNMNDATQVGSILKLYRIANSAFKSIGFFFSTENSSWTVTIDFGQPLAI